MTLPSTEVSVGSTLILNNDGIEIVMNVKNPNLEAVSLPEKPGKLPAEVLCKHQRCVLFWSSRGSQREGFPGFITLTFKFDEPEQYWAVGVSSDINDAWLASSREQANSLMRRLCDMSPQEYEDHLVILPLTASLYVDDDILRQVLPSGSV